MFKPRVSKPANLYNVNQVLLAGTAVSEGSDGFLVPAVSGSGTMGFLATDVRDWTTRTEKEILFPELYFGFLLSPVFINQPQVTYPTKVGVRIGAGYEYEIQMSGTTLVIGDLLVADVNGHLVKANGDGRTVLAVVKEPGMGVGLPLDYLNDPSQAVYIIRTLV